MKLGATIAMIILIGGIGVASMPVELSTTTLDNNKTITSKYKEEEDSTTVSSTIITANIGTSSSGLKTEIHTTQRAQSCKSYRRLW